MFIVFGFGEIILLTMHTPFHDLFLIVVYGAIHTGNIIHLILCHINSFLDSIHATTYAVSAKTICQTVQPNISRKESGRACG